MKSFWTAFLAALCLVVTLKSAPASEHSPDAIVTVDWARQTGLVNRALFSSQGFMQVYDQPNPMVLHTFKLINPRDTQTRLETWIHRMEPVNDNDDPNVFNWDRLYPDRMIRFIEDRAAFEKVYRDELGMEPLSLLCYNVDWNMSDDPDWPLKSIDEWVEFAAAVVEAYNGSGDDYTPNMRLAQVWNEPNMKMFYTGTMESYFELFNAVADRIHRDYPGVMVGGPTITHSGLEPAKWMEEFIRHCGDRADYIIFHHYGPMGQGHEILMESVERYAAMFRAIPGKERGQVMITETDAWFRGWEKAQFILDRQFGFITQSDLLMAVHHFSCLAYGESGNHTFGIVDENGGVIGGVFWPYWLFRNYIGEETHWLAVGNRRGDVNVVASRHHEDGALLANTVIHNRAEEDAVVRVNLHFDAADADRVLVMDLLRSRFHGVEEAVLVPAGTSSHTLEVRLAPGEAAGLTLRGDGERHFAFRDINNQETPWVELLASETTMNLGDRIRMKARVLNTRLEPISGEIAIEGIPSDWPVRLVSGSPRVTSLEFGTEQEATYEVTMASLVAEGEVAPYATLKPSAGADFVMDVTPHSIPVTIDLPQPVESFVLPWPVYTQPGEENLFEVQLTCTPARDVEVTVEVDFPAGFSAPSSTVTTTLNAGERARVPFAFTVGANVEPRRYRVPVRVSLLGSHIIDEAEIVVAAQPESRPSAPVALDAFLNFDPISFRLNPGVVDDMGNFQYPGDYTPSGRALRVHGLDFVIADLESGDANAILPKGQTIPVSPVKAEAVAFLGFGHDGKHPGTWKLHYDDGSVVPIESEIPEWCVTPPAGTRDAFNAPHRYMTGGALAPPACQFWMWTVPAEPDRVLTAVELPEFDRAAYLFAISVVRPEK